jgi:molybdopterin synthase catalytic subunit
MRVPRFAITGAAPDLAALIRSLEADGAGDGPSAGAFASFLGVVRRENRGRRVTRLEYEAYEPLALKAFERIADEARHEWPEAQLALHHRIGVVEVGEVSVAIAATAPHRAEAFAVCRYAIERVKQIAPIWKREHFEGGDVWIEGATADPDDTGARDEARRRACA